MATNDQLRPLWWMTPIQVAVALTAGFNAGATGLQSTMVMRMLELPDVPALYAGKQIRWLLSASDKFFPTLNAFGTVTNLVLGVVCFIKRHDIRIAGVKLPWLATAWLCNVGATAYTLILMVPLNNQMRSLAEKVESNPENEKYEQYLRQTQKKWRAMAHIRTAIMTAASASGMYTLFLDGKYL